ncbi:MAG TPA: FHA domain-containing protein [Polyangia bacterium]
MRTLLVVVLGLWATQVRAAALFSGPPRVDAERENLTFAVGAQQATPGRVVLEKLAVSIDGDPAGVVVESYPDIASQRAAAASKPGLAIGVLFFWGQGAPQELLEGLPKLMSRFPPNTPVYPVPYGEGHPSFVTPRVASDIAGGELDTLTLIPGERPVLARALRFAKQELLKEAADVRFLIVLTDGRDAEQGADANGFYRLGQELLSDRLVVQVVSFPAAVEPSESLANAAAIARGANGRHLTASGPADLAAVIEAASLSYLDMKQVSVPIPFGLRVLGGRPKLLIEAQANGRPVRLDLRGAVAAGPHRWWFVALFALIALGVAWQLFLRPSARGGGGPVREMLDELERQVRLGSPANRIVLDLSRKFPHLVDRITRLDPDTLPEGSYLVLKSDAGRVRLEEVQEQLSASRQDDRGGDLVEELARSVAADSDPGEAAVRLRACLPDGVCGAFARSSFRDVVKMLKDATPRHPELGSAAARQLVLSIQDRLRSERGEPVIVGWLIRAGGPGRRGQTLPINRPGTVIGRDAGCELSLSEDAQLATRHAIIVEQAGVFVIRPLDGQVRVEAEAVPTERGLVDGDTIELGAGAYVFKSVVFD